ncbi:hypothetical protein GS506_07460 [Rhodococcus hoagii]|nr:hypothetical protein [Prescottella equi]
MCEFLSDETNFATIVTHRTRTGHPTRVDRSARRVRRASGAVSGVGLRSPNRTPRTPPTR